MREKIFSLTKKDFRVDTFKAGGKGGQNQNKRDTGVRITHIETGISSECREERSQGQNKKRAFEKLANGKAFRVWLSAKALAISGDIDRVVNEQMQDKNLKVEVGVTKL